MIQINFPPDPSKLIFILSRQIPGVYLLARAVRHYGADNLIVFDEAYMPRPNTDPFDRRSRSRATANIADILGLTSVKYPRYPFIRAGEDVGLEDSLSSNRLHCELRAAALNTLQRLISVDVDLDLDELRTSCLVHSDAVLSTLAASVGEEFDVADFIFAIDAVRPNEDSKKPRGMDLVTLTHPSCWHPLVNYRISDIIKSAHEEGLLNTLASIPRCLVDDTDPCGQCSKCKDWKMQLIEAEVV